jgi:hypothetical protein
MARTPKFKWIQTSRGWQVNVPVTVSDTGKRERHFFPTRDKAKEYAQNLRAKFLEHGGNAAAIKPSLAEDATRAAVLLEPWGASLVQAARAYVDARELEAASVPLSVATAAWILTCEHLRKSTLAGYNQTVKKLDAALGKTTLASITTEQLQAAIVEGTTPAVAAHRYRHARAFWRWSCAKGWCRPEPLEDRQGNRDPHARASNRIAPQCRGSFPRCGGELRAATLRRDPG